MEIIAIVSVVAAVLQIILFFKVWGMTNDVKALKKDHFNETAFETKGEMARYLRNNLVLGNMENVKKTLLKNFIDNVEQGYAEMRYNSVNRDGDFLDESITPYVDSLILQYAKIGEEVPVYISGMKTFRDYFKLFVKSDLTVKVEKKAE